ncbi:GntR family transcriptional repressor for pyruvate dehydrogenase complex [Frondihabitans sp. PhB188]|uniref:FadR/GntR family transcriptional regulator n=1 Tax=Frondihabitans sp. PhB188 TaxID=2485200 RepID=UPI000F49DD5B|nr:FadR/GntR family transcriptional regulator [Frondihabitans sp. PhB188]ROQ38723.1 GntR family transcriptional repressor for pyruvate dehydrogenase complex [Frondihabitans sp. PhB188]
MSNDELVEFRRRSRPLGSELAAHLEQQILNDTYPPGSVLPAEREMAVSLGVSRTSLRDALQELEGKHLIERHHGKASRVLPLDMESLAVQERLHPIEDRIQHVIEVENLVEPGVARLAAERATAADVLQLESILGRSSEHLAPEASLDLDVDFHYTLARVTRNNFMVGISGLASERTRETRLLAHTTVETRADCIRGHAAIVRAVSDHDADAAELAMRSHLEAVHRSMRVPG